MLGVALRVIFVGRTLDRKEARQLTGGSDLARERIPNERGHLALGRKPEREHVERFGRRIVGILAVHGHERPIGIEDLLQHGHLSYRQSTARTPSADCAYSNG